MLLLLLSFLFLNYSLGGYQHNAVSSFYGGSEKVYLRANPKIIEQKRVVLHQLNIAIGSFPLSIKKSK
jgi:hypothetical protein